MSVDAELRVDARGLRMRRGRAVFVDSFDLVVRAGEAVALVGPNGAGKTTLLQGIAGILPSTGALRVGAVDPRDGPRKVAARHVALMTQRLYTPFGLTVEDLVLIGGTAHASAFGGASARERDRAFQTAERLGIAPIWARDVGALSGGERQRAHAASVFFQRAPTVLLDEPCAAQDFDGVARIMREIDRTVQEGACCVVAMHDLTLALRCFDRVVLMQRGRCVFDGPSTALHDGALLREVYGDALAVEHAPGGPVVALARTTASTSTNAGAADTRDTLSRTEQT